MSCTEGKKAFKARDSERQHITITCPDPDRMAGVWNSSLNSHDIRSIRASGWRVKIYHQRRKPSL